MKKQTKNLLLLVSATMLASCGSDNEKPIYGNLTLHFNNTFKNATIVLGDAGSSEATKNTSAAGQIHHFSELKYVISNIRLVKTSGEEVSYHVGDLDRGAVVIDQAKPQTLDFALADIPAGEYYAIKFGLGVKSDLNTLDEERFPKFYAEAGANDTKMMWEWGTGYRFVKIEGFYGADNAELSIHTGSTVEGTNGDPDSYTQGVDAYRDVILALPNNAVVGGRNEPKITIKADFDKLLSGKANTIKLGPGNATPSVHTAVNMLLFVDNLGGDGKEDSTGMFAVESVEN